MNPANPFRLTGFVLLLVLAAGCGQEKEKPMLSGDEAAVTRRMDSWSKDAPELTIDLPRSWTYQKHKGPDFDVHWFSDPNGSGSLGIYVGHHPNLRKAATATVRRLSVGDREVEFFSEPQEGTVLTQGLVSEFFNGCADPAVARLMLHLMIREQKTGFTPQAVRALATLKIRRKE